MKKKNLIAIFLIIIFVFSIVPRTFQNDTFYTITIGRDILTYGFDGIDHYSWHSGLSYTSPHWLFDVVNYLIYNVSGFNGLYLGVCILSSIAMIIFYMFLRKKNVNWITALAGTLISAYLLKNNLFTDRAQIASYMLFLIEIYFIESFLENKKKRNIFGIFLISVIIANIHAAVWPFMFVLVVPYIAEYFFAIFAIDNVAKNRIKKDEKKLENLKAKNADESEIKKLEESIKFDENFIKNYKPRENRKIEIVKRDNAKFLFCVIIAIAIGGFLTPTGSLPFVYFIKASKSNVMSYINEHLPLVVASSMESIVVIILTITCIGFIDSKMKLSDAFLLLGLYIMMLYSRRHLILLILLGGPILICMIDDFINRNITKEDDWEEKRKILDNVFLGIFIMIALGVGCYELDSNYGVSYIDESSYPVEATDWLKNYIEENNISKEDLRLFNEYNFGSYLLYQGIPVFIDSRAEQPYCSTFNKDVTVFNDYMEVTTGQKSYTELFEKYNINYAIVYKTSVENTYMKEDSKCQELYSDDNFVIYKYE